MRILLNSAGRKTLLEYLLRFLRKPEVVLLGSWWLITLALLAAVADVGELLLSIWKPLIFLIGVPILGFAMVLVVTL